jgi:hypothetical protein
MTFLISLGFLPKPLDSGSLPFFFSEVSLFSKNLADFTLVKPLPEQL